MGNRLTLDERSYHVVSAMPSFVLLPAGEVQNDDIVSDHIDPLHDVSQGRSRCGETFSDKQRVYCQVILLLKVYIQLETMLQGTVVSFDCNHTTSRRLSDMKRSVRSRKRNGC